MNETIEGAKSPKCTNGLCVAIVKNKDDIDSAASRLADEMDSTGAHTGILLVGSDFARSFFGPVPQEWSSKGIGIVVGQSDDLAKEANALFNEYQLGIQAVEASLGRLDAPTGQSALQTAREEQAARRIAEEGTGMQHKQVHVTTQIPKGAPIPVAAQVHAKPQSLMGPVRETLQRAGSAASMGGSMGMGSMAGSVQASSMQSGGTQGDYAQGNYNQGDFTEGGSLHSDAPQESGASLGAAGGTGANSSGGTAGASGATAQGCTQRGGNS